MALRTPCVRSWSRENLSEPRVLGRPAPRIHAQDRNGGRFGIGLLAAEGLLIPAGESVTPSGYRLFARTSFADRGNEVADAGDDPSLLHGEASEDRSADSPSGSPTWKR